VTSRAVSDGYKCSATHFAESFAMPSVDASRSLADLAPQVARSAIAFRGNKTAQKPDYSPEAIMQSETSKMQLLYRKDEVTQ